jgi:hypothetical protein
MGTRIDGVADGGGGGSVPSGSAGDAVTLDGAGGLSALALADLIYRSRRAPADSLTRLLWECDGASGDLVNTGSLGSAGNLSAGGTLGRNRIDRDSNNRPISTLGRGIYCDGTSAGQARGAAGVIPTGASSSITAWCAAVVPSGWTGNQTLLARDYAASGWGPPYIGLMLSLRGGSRAVAHVNGSGTYASADIALPSSSGLILVGLTYDGSTLSLWGDGTLLGTASASGPIDWGGAGEWHLGGNGSGEYFTGTILRAGVTQGVWNAARWRQEMNRTLWGWTG